LTGQKLVKKNCKTSAKEKRGGKKDLAGEGRFAGIGTAAKRSKKKAGDT